MEIVDKETPSEDVADVRKETELPSDIAISMDIREECMRIIEDVDGTREEALDKDTFQSVEVQISCDKQIVTDERMEEEPIVSEADAMEVITNKKPDQRVPDPE